jgi:hypothetical protein
MQFVLNNGTRSSIDTIYGDRWGDVFSDNSCSSKWLSAYCSCGKVYDLPVGFPSWKPYSEPELIGRMLTNNNLKTEQTRFKNHSCNTTKIKSWIKALCLYQL